MSEKTVISGALILGDLRDAWTAQRDVDAAVPSRRGEMPTAVPEFGDIEDILYWHWDGNEERGGTDVTVRAVFSAGWRSPGFWYVAAWNDYTGWGCQDGASFRWAPDLDELIRFGLEAEDRRRWGLSDV